MAHTDFLEGIADAIRYAEKSTGEISAQKFAERIRALSGSEPTPEAGVVVPQTGTWQLKETTGKKYIILGTDDDNNGNAKYFRLLRTYGFPYTMNVEAENASKTKALGSDVDDTIFTSDDAPALFPDGVDVITVRERAANDFPVDEIRDMIIAVINSRGDNADLIWTLRGLVQNLGEYKFCYHCDECGDNVVEYKLKM